VPWVTEHLNVIRHEVWLGVMSASMSSARQSGPSAFGLPSHQAVSLINAVK
jgi:hypothetical protein